MEDFGGGGGGRSRGRTGRKRGMEDDTAEYKSKNLDTERRRRQKLNERLLALRSLVPIITNASAGKFLESHCSSFSHVGFRFCFQMNKATIVEDAITYIRELQSSVDVLTDQLLQAEAAEAEARRLKMTEAGNGRELEECLIQEEVTVSAIHGKRLWVEIILEKKRGRFSKLVEAMTGFGFVLLDTNVTSAKGAFLITSSVQGLHEEALSVQKAKDLLQGIVHGI